MPDTSGSEPADRKPLDEALALLYVECRWRSGGFEHAPSWNDVVAHGKAAIPRLLTDLKRHREDDEIHPWVVLWLLATLAGDDRPNLKNPDDRGRFGPVTEMWLEWGRERRLVS